jgi:putative ATP-dependent endonuclease of OLD family
MSVVRKIEVYNFRALKRFEWLPSAGINCLVGPGDSGKSTILDAIDLCIGARRNLQITDADFHGLNIDAPIQISVTLGGLDDQLKSIDAYGLYLRSFDQATGEVSDEPEAEQETVLTAQLTVEGDLEPQWTLVSDRAAAQSQTRNLNWNDRVRLAPTRVGAFNEHNLSWRRGSILNRVSEERADASAALVKAARNVREAFGEQAKEQLGQALQTVLETAVNLGISVGAEVKALLDAHSVSFTGGTISLHDERGVPLKALGLGSTRLLVAGLQRHAADKASIVLIDELEHGLEPHRIIRLIDALGAKEKKSPLQVFMTTHSPVAVRELSGSQLYVVRRVDDAHTARLVGIGEEVQGAIRLFPEALLAPSILVCEGASEVGLIRGLDQYRTSQGKRSIMACGVAIVDGGGNNTFRRAIAFRSLGYRVAVLRDSDVQPASGVEAVFTDGAGGQVFAWRAGCALEDELFLSLSDDAVMALLDKAVELKEDGLVDEHIKSASNNAKNLNGIRMETLTDGMSDERRAVLCQAAKCGKGWFKNVSAMGRIAREVIGPDLPNADGEFRAIIDKLFEWATDGEQ